MTPFRRRVAYAATALSLTATPPATAAIEKALPPTALSDAEFRAILPPVLAAARAENCPKVLGLLDPVLPRVTGRNRTAAQLLRLPCLAGSGRGSDVAAVYNELIVSDPRNPIIRNVGVIVALSDGQFVEAGTRLASLAEDDPAALTRLTGGVARGITQALTEQKAYAVRGRLFIALARADWQPEDRPEMRDGLAQGAIEALMGAGRTEEAEGLLPRVVAPELLAGMAMERHYAPLWPAIEARMGAHGAASVARFAAQRLDAFADQPDDADARRDATRSFLLLGRLSEASEVAKPVQITATMGEADVATVNYDAQALAASGKVDAAVARLQPFTTLDLSRLPMAASALVSLAEMLDENGREDEALTVAQTTLQHGGDALSGWGVGWLKRTEVCALAALGRQDEANRLGDALKAGARHNEAAAVEGLLCLKRDDEAAAIAVATLKTPEGAATIADQFQPEDALWARMPSRLRALWTPLRQRRDVKAAFDKAARILPETLWPEPGPRPIPRVVRPDDVPVT